MLKDSRTILRSLECAQGITVLYLKLREIKLSFIVSCTGRKFTANNTMSIHPQIIEKEGIKEFAVLPYQEFLEIQQILEDYEDIQELREAKALEFNAPTRPLSQVLAEARQI
jgi:hypothetical protein